MTLLRLQTAIGAVILGLGFGIAASYAADHLTPTAPRYCFSKRVWSANDANRPCARITRLFEDGSYWVRVREADGDRWEQR